MVILTIHFSESCLGSTAASEGSWAETPQNDAAAEGAIARGIQRLPGHAATRVSGDSQERAIVISEMVLPPASIGLFQLAHAP